MNEFVNGNTYNNTCVNVKKNLQYFSQRDSNTKTISNGDMKYIVYSYKYKKTFVNGNQNQKEFFKKWFEIIGDLFIPLLGISEDDLNKKFLFVEINQSKIHSVLTKLKTNIRTGGDGFDLGELFLISSVPLDKLQEIMSELKGHMSTHGLEHGIGHRKTLKAIVFYVCSENRFHVMYAGTSSIRVHTLYDVFSIIVNPDTYNKDPANQDDPFIVDVVNYLTVLQNDLMNTLSQYNETLHPKL